MNLASRIEKRLNLLNKSERQACLEAKLSDSFIRNIRLGKSTNPRMDTLARLAIVLHTTPEWLSTGRGIEDLNQQKIAPNTSLSNINNKSHGAFLVQEPDEGANAIFLPNRFHLRNDRTVPVYGHAVGGEDGSFELNGNRLYDVPCPSSLFDSQAAYAIEVVGNSMSPRYEPGEIAYVDPLREVRRGDYVVVQISSDDGEVPQAYIKKYLFRTDREVVLEQINPHKRLTFPLEKLLSIHYVAMSGPGI